MIGTKPRRKSREQPHPLSLRTQLILGTGLILSLATISAVIGYLSLRNLQTSTEDTLLTANRIRDLSLAMQNDFLLARQNEAGLLAEWQTSGFDVSASVFVVANQSNLDQARVALNSIASLVQSTKNAHLQSLQTEIDALRPLLEDYQKTFQNTEAILRENSKAGGAADNGSQKGSDPDTAHQNTAHQNTSLEQNIGRSNELAGEIDRMMGTINVKSEAGLVWARGQINRINRNATLVFGVSAGLAILLGTVAAGGLARWMLLPINQLVRAAAQIGHGDLSARAELRGGAELITLAEALNSMAVQLQQTLANLEQRVGERTRDLERRNDQLQAAAEIASVVGGAGTTDVLNAGAAWRELRATKYGGSQLNELLSRIADLIRDRFGYSQVRIFTVDETGEWAILRALAGEPWPTEPAQSKDSSAADSSAIDKGAFRLRTGDSNPVILAVENGQPQLNPDRPRSSADVPTGTYTELALPLREGGKVTGVLDVRNLRASALQATALQTAGLAEDITVLQILADQLAIAIRNAQLFQELKDRLGELETLYAHQSQGTWQRLAQTGLRGYQYQPGEITRLTRETQVRGEAADNGASAGGSGAQQLPDSIRDRNGVAPISIPIAVRGQVIGTLDVWPETEDWPEGKTSMLQAIGDRLSQAIESARLFEEVQRRAERERMITEITSRVRASTNVDTIMLTAIQELAEKLDISTASIQIRDENGELAHG